MCAFTESSPDTKQIVNEQKKPIEAKVAVPYPVPPIYRSYHEATASPEDRIKYQGEYDLFKAAETQVCDQFIQDCLAAGNLREMRNKLSDWSYGETDSEREHLFPNWTVSQLGNLCRAVDQKMRKLFSQKKSERDPGDSLIFTDGLVSLYDLQSNPTAYQDVLNKLQSEGYTRLTEDEAEDLSAYNLRGDGSIFTDLPGYPTPNEIIKRLRDEEEMDAVAVYQKVENGGDWAWFVYQK